MKRKMIPGYHWYTPFGDLLIRMGQFCGGRLPKTPRRRRTRVKRVQVPIKPRKRAK